MLTNIHCPKSLKMISNCNVNTELIFFFLRIFLNSSINKQQQEQDPTNLYIANLPTAFKETDLENLLSKYGQVISTRILRDQQGQSKGNEIQNQ